jgi:hypothetical protein
MCDCKYGLGVNTDDRFGSEQTGCPELTEIINRLLHRPESLSGDVGDYADAKNKGYDLAVDQALATLNQMKDPRNFGRTL